MTEKRNPLQRDPDARLRIATRFYLPDSGRSSVFPPFSDSWESTEGAVRRPAIADDSDGWEDVPEMQDGDTITVEVGKRLGWTPERRLSHTPRQYAVAMRSYLLVGVLIGLAVGILLHWLGA